MDFQNLLLNVNGRQRRLHFWLVAIGIAIVNSIIANFTWQPAYVAMLMHTGGPGWGPVAYLGCLLSLGLFVLSTINAIKRLHDRDKSGWWFLAMFVASLTLVGALWPLIELGFLDGTPGPNKFGPSPKGVGGAAPAV